MRNCFESTIPSFSLIFRWPLIMELLKFLECDSMGFSRVILTEILALNFGAIRPRSLR